MFNVLFKFVHIQVCSFSTLIKAIIRTHFSGETIAYSSRKKGPVVNCRNVMSLLFCCKMSEVLVKENAYMRPCLILSDDVGLGFRILPAGLKLVAQA